MGKRSRKDTETAEVEPKTNGRSKKSIIVDEASIDPNLALLFSSSAGPVKAPPKSRYEEPPPPLKRKAVVEAPEDNSEAESEGDEDELSSVDEDLEDADIDGLSEQESEESDGGAEIENIVEAPPSKKERKRKRKNDEEDLEGKYMQKLAREEEREEEERHAERRLKRQKLLAAEDRADDREASEAEEDEEAAENDSEDESDEEKPTRTAPSDVPLHESLQPNKDAVELEKASRTVFLANVSTLAISSKTAKKTLLTHMGSFIDSLPAPPEGKPAHKVESIRFRSTAYAGGGLPKKAAFAKKELMDATTKSTNAYVVYSTAYAAREAVKRLNATMVLDRHLRVDGVAHPAKTDHRRCVFVGNLGFVDDESMLDQGGENERKRSKVPSDVEEGLWRQFGKAGAVESVRVVRDEKTRVGKGFAYVQFEDPNAVEAALLFNEKKYPPMLPRVLRVVRAKAVRKTALASAASRTESKKPKKDRVFVPKATSEFSSLKGRASKLLGKAGASQFKKAGSGANTMAIGRRGDGEKSAGVEGIAKTPESIVFEGFRASAKNGKPKDLKFGKGGGKKGGNKGGKPQNRGAKRATAWKKSGGKKA
ncbi:related to nucleolar protein 12 [Phialocephala subalpina]|uniref:Nucleolar protein 12 n=1 Tax=Phialocephala subalpina TaxID=576137 RepID=A0A1L7WMX7_9HELO|nr:related to nucleolar protein 12 [Phialocephala subalpina]